MNKKITGIYLALLTVGIIYALFQLQTTHDYAYVRDYDRHAQAWNDQMEQTIDDGIYYYKAILPEENVEGKVVAYETAHMYLDVKIGRETVYSLKQKDDQKIKTTGYWWNFITLNEEDAGREIVFVVKPAYADTKPKGSFYYGMQSEVERLIERQRAFRFAVCLLIVIVGIVLLIYVLLVVRKQQKDDALLQFSMFAITLGVWSLCETQLLELILREHILVVFLDQLTLMVIPIPFLLFLRQMYHNKEHPLWNFCCYSNCVVVGLRILLQLLGILDLRETLFWTHIAIIITALVIVGLSINEIVVNKLTRLVRLNVIGVLVMLAATLLELGIYRINNTSQPIGSIGFLFYIIMMGIENVRKSHRIIERAKENEIYRKLAFTDELTGMYNRTAFQRDIDSRSIIVDGSKERQILPTIIFMFDLNNLKKCNDTYGHEYGDQYIQMSAEIIVRVFGLDGKCYRIGGDEFCVIMAAISQNEIDGKLRQMERHVREQNRKKFVVPVGIAAGYAVYKSDMDENLEATRRRADEMMYVKKQNYKKQHAG